MSLRSYVDVLRSPGALAPAVGTALASVPVGVVGLALLLLVEQRTGSFRAAGALVAALGAGTVLGMVLQGRLVDRFGPRPVLTVAATVRVLATAAVLLAVESRPLVVVVLLVVALGASEPQVGGTLRALWPVLVGPRLRPAAAALSSMLFELPVLAGPLLLVVIAPEAALVVAAALAAVGSALVAGSGVAGRWRRSPRRRGPALLAVRTVLAVTAVQGVAVGSVQVTAVAAAPDRAGLLYAVLTAGSLLGSTVYGAVTRPQVSGYQVPVLLLGVGAVLALTAAGPLVACVLGFGLLVGPLTVRCFLDLDRQIPGAAATTGLIATGLAATSAGVAAAGWAVDAGRAGELLLLVGCGVAVLALTVLITARRSS